MQLAITLPIIRELALLPRGRWGELWWWEEEERRVWVMGLRKGRELRINLLLNGLRDCFAAFQVACVNCKVVSRARDILIEGGLYQCPHSWLGARESQQAGAKDGSHTCHRSGGAYVIFSSRTET